MLTYGTVSLNVSFYYAVDDDQDEGYGLAPEDFKKLIKSTK